MVLCNGTLVVHRDSVPVYCSEEIAGRACGDYDLTRHRSIASCRLVYVATGCQRCADHVGASRRQLVRSGRAA